jgi:folate-binding protein YgfZ
MVRKFVNPRVTMYTDVSDVLHDIGLFGVGARVLLAQSLGASESDLASLTSYSHRTVEVDGRPVMVARVPDAGVEGYELFAAPEVLRALSDVAVARGATPATAAAFDVARIEAGRPEWGIDMDDNTLPQEASLDQLNAISYTKGCYTGQETVARVHFRGHVNRQLRGLRFDPSFLPPSGSELVDGTDERVVGDVRSVAVSPRLGGIALAMVRREVEPGSDLRAKWPAGSCGVQVVSLPFPT